jgi:hypothetical protein
MLSIDNAIEYLLSEECGKQDITNKVLTDMNIISDNLINNKYNIINCILYYFTNYFEELNEYVFEKFLIHMKKIFQKKKFFKTYDINFTKKKSVFLKSFNNNFNDTIGMLFLGKFFNCNIILTIKDKIYFLLDNSEIDIYKPYITLNYDITKELYLPMVKYGSNKIIYDHEEFSNILSNKNCEIININLKNSNTELISLTQYNPNIISESSTSEEMINNTVDEETQKLLNKSDSALLKERKDILVTILGRLNLYKSGDEKKPKKELLSMIRTYN